MTDQNAAAAPRRDEAQLQELVWAHNPATGSPVKQMTRGKLQVLSRSGYVETTAPAASDASPKKRTTRTDKEQS